MTSIAVEGVEADPRVQPIRRFNRFYSRIIGGLAKGYLDTPYSLAEARVIHEVAMNPGCTAKNIRAKLDFDQGHLSRIISRIEKSGVIERRKSEVDRRSQELWLTKKGEEFYQDMSRRADEQAQELMGHLPEANQRRLLEAMETIQGILDDGAPQGNIIIRDSRIGDLGYAFARQVEAYNEQYGYSQVFETYFCNGLPNFLQNFDPARNKLWVAELNRRPVGWIAIQHNDERPSMAQLRWFYVEPEARGRGLGKELLGQSIHFSRQAGYEGIFLWTVSNLDSARRLYQAAGFQLAQQLDEPCKWAPSAHEQMWELHFNDENPP